MLGGSEVPFLRSQQERKLKQEEECRNKIGEQDGEDGKERTHTVESEAYCCRWRSGLTTQGNGSGQASNELPLVVEAPSASD